MDLIQSIIIIAILILVSAFFSMSEISLSAARRLRLRQWADEGNVNAQKVLNLQDSPGRFFTVVQIALNAVAILAGILGESALTPYYQSLIGFFYQGTYLANISFGFSFITVVSVFILFADLIPKRIALLYSEAISVRVIVPMLWCIALCRPLIWFFNGLANKLFKFFGIAAARKNDITYEDIAATVAAGAEAGVVLRDEQQLIENVFELESRAVTSAMTVRENVVWLPSSADSDLIREIVGENPHGKFLVCEQEIDQVLGYVDTTDLFVHVLNEKPLTLKTDGLVRQALIVPDTLKLFEILPRFKSANEDFAVILNEYAFVVGVITLNDVMSTLMGDLVSSGEEAQIVKRDENSWLIDGMTPIDDVLRELDIDDFPDRDHYDTIAGFVIYTLRKIPKRTDFVMYEGHKFEVIDVDNFKIDQLLVTKEKLPEAAPPNNAQSTHTE